MNISIVQDNEEIHNYSGNAVVPLPRVSEYITLPSPLFKLLVTMVEYKFPYQNSKEHCSVLITVQQGE